MSYLLEKLYFVLIKTKIKCRHLMITKIKSISIYTSFFLKKKKDTSINLSLQVTDILLEKNDDIEVLNYTILYQYRLYFLQLKVNSRLNV